MGKIYEGQTELTITANLLDDITGYSAVYIKYRKPSGTEGQWTATVSDAATGVITYTITSASDLDEVGVWHLWGYVVFSDGDELPGESERVVIYKEGN